MRNDGDRVVIGRVVKGGLAERSQLFHDGDELLEVNGYDLRGRNVTEVCDILVCFYDNYFSLIFPLSLE